jgi:hypothetical protein
MDVLLEKCVVVNISSTTGEKAFVSKASLFLDLHQKSGVYLILTTIPHSPDEEISYA